MLAPFSFLKSCQQSGRLREVVAYGKSIQNKPSARLTDQLHKNITLSAKIRQIETELLYFFTCNTFREMFNIKLKSSIEI